MNNNIKELCREAHEFIVNAHAAMMNEEITEDEYNEVIKNLLLDVGYRAEVLIERIEE